MELLLSLAVVAVLLSILLPALSYGRTVSQRTVCAGQLRQIGVAFQSYLHDNRKFPQPETERTWNYGGATFRGVDHATATLLPDRPINQYISDHLPDQSGELTGIFHCPGDTGVWRKGPSPRRPGQSVIDPSCFRHFGTSYRANPYLMDSTLAGIDSQARPVGEHEVFVDRSRLLIAGDAVWHYATRPSDDVESGLDASWHGRAGAGNMMAMDGSVRFIEFSPAPSSEYVLKPRPD